MNLRGGSTVLNESLLFCEPILKRCQLEIMYLFKTFFFYFIKPAMLGFYLNIHKSCSIELFRPILSLCTVALTIYPACMFA